MVNNAGIDYAEARLDEFAGEIVTSRASDMGYPMNQKSQLKGFYRWFAGSGLNLTMVKLFPVCHDSAEILVDTAAYKQGGFYGADGTDAGECRLAERTT